MNVRWCRIVLALLVIGGGLAAFGEDACERLAAAKIPHTTITLAQTEAAGTFNGPPAPFTGMDISALYKSAAGVLPRGGGGQAHGGFRYQDGGVAAVVWMEWKAAGTSGNGGFAGLIDDMQLGMALKAGYAAYGDRHGSRGIADRCGVGDRASGEGRGLRASRNPRDDTRGEGAWCRRFMRTLRSGRILPDVRMAGAKR